jgi:hypothetical protein
LSVGVEAGISINARILFRGVGVCVRVTTAKRRPTPSHPRRYFLLYDR